MLKGFCQQTSLNGFAFFYGNEEVSGKRHIIYTLIWGAVIAVSIFYASALTIQTYKAYMESGVNLNLVSPSGSMDDISFPVTIVCNTKLLRSSLVHKLIEDPKLEDMTFSDIEEGLIR